MRDGRNRQNSRRKRKRVYLQISSVVIFRCLRIGQFSYSVENGESKYQIDLGYPDCMYVELDCIYSEIWVKLTSNGDDNVQRTEHQALHVVRFPIHDQQVDENHANEQGDSLWMALVLVLKHCL
jgi:hypothetical protein